MFSVVIFFFKQKTAYEMRISDWSSDVCSSDLPSSAEASACPSSARTKWSRPVSRQALTRRPGSDPPPATIPILGAMLRARLANGAADRKSVVEGKRVSVRVDHGGRRNIQTKNKPHNLRMRHEKAKQIK